MENNLLSRNECNALRGLAILGIVLHNYCHWLRGIVRENEYQYFQHNVDGLLRAVAHPDWNLPVHLLSFFGHYGVPVFLFLSAYGLVMKYEKDQQSSSAATQKDSPLTFIRIHFLKLFKMMFVGYVAFLMVDAITPGSFHNHVLLVIAQLGLFNNLLPHPDDIIWPGPYWFFGLMLQLYIVYRLMLHRRHWGFTVALIALCTVAQMVCGPESDALNYVRYNFVGGMLPFGLGLLYGRYGRQLKTSHHVVAFVGGLCLVVLLSQNYYAWFFVPVFVLVSSVGFVKLLPQAAVHPLVWLGGISAALFICHPITRKVFIPVSHRGDLYTGLFIYVITSVALAWLFRELLKRIPNPK